MPLNASEESKVSSLLFFFFLRGRKMQTIKTSCNLQLFARRKKAKGHWSDACKDPGSTHDKQTESECSQRCKEKTAKAFVCLNFTSCVSATMIFEVTPLNLATSVMHPWLKVYTGNKLFFFYYFHVSFPAQICILSNMYICFTRSKSSSIVCTVSAVWLLQQATSLVPIMSPERSLSGPCGFSSTTGWKRDRQQSKHRLKRRRHIRFLPRFILRSVAHGERTAVRAEGSYVMLFMRSSMCWIIGICI